MFARLSAARAWIARRWATPLTAVEYARITRVALAAIILIIVTGAAVRLTGSGMGCTEWPTCQEGSVVAPLEVKPWIEFGNRLITGVVSIAVVAAVLGSLRLDERRPDLTRWSWGLVAGVGAQALLGGASVKMHLAPPFITAHFLLSIVLVWNAVVLHLRATRPPTAPVPVVGDVMVNVGRAVVVMAAVVLVTGTLVTGTGPHAGDEDAERYTFATITEVARVHSVTVWVFLAVAVVALSLVARSGAPAQVVQRGSFLLGAIVFQGALGYAQYAAGVPAYLVIVHVFGSVVVFVAALVFHLGLFARPAAEAPIDEAATSPAEIRRPVPAAHA